MLYNCGVLTHREVEGLRAPPAVWSRCARSSPPSQDFLSSEGDKQCVLLKTLTLSNHLLIMNYISVSITVILTSNSSGHIVVAAIW